MGTSTWQPKWWTQDKHESTWDRVKEAMKRDWEQTKADFSTGRRDLNQDVDDTLKQAAGKDVIPQADQPNAPGGTPMPKDWHDVESPMRYGVGARQQYGHEHAGWNDTLEGTLKKEWDEGKGAGGHGWTDVRHYVRTAYERSHK